ncbi:MAG: sigma-70 family RNA polymerase sigma factor, partial [Acidobacteriota bacterium]|nr:sigma-70 family RNA polymerase sigma factor [Acidobacteriota bacterium]
MAAAASIDAAFLRRLRSRDPEALAQAVAEHARPLFRAARGMGLSAEDAEDLVQEVFVILIRRVDSFEGRSQLRTWLFGVLHRKALEQRRHAARDLAHEPIEDVMESRFDLKGNWLHPPADLEKLVQSAEIGSMLANCLEGIGPLQRAGE